MQNRSEYKEVCYQRENSGALMELQAFEKYLDKEVRVVKGRKVPIWNHGNGFLDWDEEIFQVPGTGGAGKSGVGIKTTEGETYFTAENNIELVA